MPTTTTATTNLTLLNSLLRGEMSAIETYRQALEKAGTEPGAADLHRFAKDHRDAAAQLWQHVERYGGKPSEGSGAWGAWAKTVEGTAKLFGNAAALKDKDLADDCRTLIRGLIEKQREHIVALDRLIAQV